MVTPVNVSSPPSSNSSSPTSESTLFSDDTFIHEVVTQIESTTPRQHSHQWDSHQSRDATQFQYYTDQRSDDSREQFIQQHSSGPINTDYESSAAEDYESYTSIKYKNAEYALLSYSRTNKLEKLRTLLEAKQNRNDFDLNLNFKGQQKQNFSWSALHLACYFGHHQVVELLLSKPQFRDEIDINIQNNSGDTPLHKATLTNRVRIVQILLANGANVSIKNSDGLFAKQLTDDKHILDMLEAAEQVDKNRTREDMFKAVDNGDLKKLQEFFENYGSYIEASQSTSTNQTPNTSGSKPSTSSDLMCQVTDDRGNTLLHLAAMRGFQAICVYLLEKGFDPYKKNGLGQSCIDLSSYQLRQLFITVKPANSRLKRLSNSRVSRFEGPLLKKVRILGWKQIYVVLENGCILLFNNRMDSMNKSRRGYKYLESASCDPDQNDVGVFNVSFSDKSRATFLVSTDHVNNYASFKLANFSDQDRSSSQINQVELVRQKWIDSIRDHIKYSTDFIKNGLKLNDYDDENEDYKDGNLASLNHLLPIDTIKSFTQEARAHYSILERHANSLCSLIQSINAANKLTSSIDVENDQEPEVAEQLPPQAVALANPATGTGSRILNFIRPSRQIRGTSVSGEDATSISSQNQVTLTNRRRNNSLTNDFIQDNWHCILFHLRLLVESTENTKVSMGQALALIEHQEQLRQHKIQDQDERCRVLEDSLHALARDHHELEKSISQSQIFHSATARSMSMSTDLNEYFDAFEDFDDDKTMTPDSMPSDEDLNRQIQDVLDAEAAYDKEANPSQAQLMQGSDANRISMPNLSRIKQFLGDHQTREAYPSEQHDCTDDDEEEEEEDDDLRSNCSALTAETISELILDGARRLVGPGEVESTKPQLSIDDTALGGSYKHRTRLPSPMVPRDQVSIWSILKNCIGKELSKITMPVVFNEPLTMLQRSCESIQHSRFLKMADDSNDPIERMELVCAFIVASLSANCHRIIKPFNPLLYETFEYTYELEDGSKVKSVAQQVSHHPPITAAYAESDNFVYNGSVNPKIKFWGRSIEVQPDGQCRIFLKRHKESYIFKSVSCSIHNIIVGKLWFEHGGPLNIKCVESDLEANLVFKQAGWFGSDLHRFDGFIGSGLDRKQSERKKLRFVYGKWSDYMKSVEYIDYENYMRENQQKLFRIPDTPDDNQVASSSNTTNGLSSKFETLTLSNSVNNNSIQQVVPNNASPQNSKTKSSKSISSKSGDKKSGYTKSESTQSLDIPNSRTLWRLESQYLEEYYNFNLFTLTLNELTPELAKTLPKTDSRFRLDVRKLEEGDLDGAANEKQQLEEKQRAARARDSRFKDPSPDFLWFSLEKVPPTNEKFWMFQGGYWENKCNPEKFPDLF